MSTENFAESFQKLVKNSENHLSNLDIFLIEELQRHKFENAQTVVDGIDTILDSIDNQFANLKQSRQKGMSRTAWLQKTLKQQTASLDNEQAGTLVNGITEALSDGEISSGNKSFSGIDAVEKVRNLDQTLIANTCKAQAELQNILLLFENSLSDSALMQKVIVDQDPIAFKQLRKIAAVCFILLNGQNESFDYISATVMADRSVFTAQTAYAAGNGEMSEADAIEALIDRFSAQVCSLLDCLLPNLIKKGIDAFVKLFEEKYKKEIPEIVVNMATAIASGSVMPLLKKGVMLLNTQIKKVWHKLKQRNPEMAEKINQFASPLVKNKVER